MSKSARNICSSQLYGSYDMPTIPTEQSLLSRWPPPAMPNILTLLVDNDNPFYRSIRLTLISRLIVLTIVTFFEAKKQTRALGD